MKKNTKKDLKKRSISLFVALAVCLTMAQAPAFTVSAHAEEVPGITEEQTLQGGDENDPDQTPDGENLAVDNIDGEKAEGGNVDGEKAEGGNVDGEKAEGGNVDGEKVEGGNVDDEKAEGGNVDGEKVEDEKADGEKVEGEDVDGENIEGQNVEGGEELECICEYRCSPLVQLPWWDDNGERIYIDYVTRTEDCPVCGGEEGDWEHNCQGKQIVVDGDPNHTHSFSTMIGIFSRIPANCTTPQAVTLLDMRCGAEWLFAFDTETGLNPDNHYYSDHKPVVKEATCTEDGSKTNTCLLCGEEIVEIIPAKGHQIENAEVVEATCISDGSRTGHCTVCGEDVVEVIPAEGHKKPENNVETKEPTCTEAGYSHYTCELCNEEITEEYPAKGHTWPTLEDFPGQKLIPDSALGICRECGATAYNVYTYEDGASPAGTGYETKLCARVIKEANGTVYGVDSDGNRLEGDEFEVIINESLMGKVKTDKNGEKTQVVGYRNMDNKNAEIYPVGASISYEDVPAMFSLKDTDGHRSWGAYYSSDDHRAIYLEAVREKVSDFVTNKVSYENAPSDPKPELRRTVSTTSSGILVSKDYNEGFTTCTITYTIPAGYTGSTVDIDATNDVMEAYRKIQDERFGYNGTQPGDTLGPVYIRVVNKSGNSYSYNDGSFILQSPSHEGTISYFEGIRTFDGTELPEAVVPSRVSNGALRYLYGRDIDGTHDELLRDLSDEVLGKQLVSKGYENGIADLHLFYLDYYNNFFAQKYGVESWENLSEVPFELLVDRTEGIFGGHSSTSALKETNPEVAGVGYSLMYTRALCVIQGNEENLKDPDGVYAVGNYMKNEVSYESNAKSVWGTLRSGVSGDLTGMSVYVHGEANDFYQNTAYSIEIGFSLTRVSTPPTTPDEPDEPDDEPKKPEEPDEPETPDNPTEEIFDEEPPLSDVPEIELSDEDVPLAEKPQEVEVPEVEVPEEEVPLADIPKTGDSDGSLWAALLAVSMAGIALLTKKLRGEE